MEILKELENIGIEQLEKVETERKIKFARDISEKLSNNVKELSGFYNELYIRIYNCDIYYAKVPEKFKGVFYFYKNNTIYISKEENDTDEYLIHEVIHYLQKFGSESYSDPKRAGLCTFLDLKIKGLGINEAIVQYITSMAMGKKIQRIENDKISFCTNSEKNYKYITSLANQIIFLMNGKQAILSTINTDDKFENDLYNTFEGGTDRILKSFDNLFEETNKQVRDEEKIINSYMQTQKDIYTTYFSNMYKRINSIEDVKNQVDKLEKLDIIIGKYLNKENEFEKFKSDMKAMFWEKYVEINKKEAKQALMVVNNNVFYKIHRRITKFFQKKFAKN